MTEKILVTGVTGYVGGRLAPQLLARGWQVRAFARDPARVRGRNWGAHPALNIAQGDMRDTESIRKALEGCSVVYYLVHSMADQGDFSAADRLAALNMATALQGSGVKRVVYLSGLVPDDAAISPHLKSREEVGRILALGEVPLTILRASQVIGVGSASFEMMRYLAERLRVMPASRLMRAHTQPISMTNVLGYLTGVLEHPETAGQTYDIGGPDIVTYRELLETYVNVAGLPKRLFLPCPMPLSMAAHLVGLMTPVPYPLAKSLMEGLCNEVVCSEHRIREIIPQPLFTVRQAVGRALGRIRSQDVDTSWMDAGMPAIPEWMAHGDPVYVGNALKTDAFTIRLKAAPADIWPMIEGIGGEKGWYGKNPLWKLRGILDRLAGGPGTQRGRRSQAALVVGDSLDFWRVLNICPERQLLLLTEMRLPGEGLLYVTLRPVSEAEGQTDLTISLYYRPQGLLGRLYWWAVMPFHGIAFRDMLRVIARESGHDTVSGPSRTIAVPLVREKTGEGPTQREQEE